MEIILAQVWNGLITGLAYSLVASGLTLIFGIMKVPNMAHGEFYMLGGVFLWVITTYLKINFFLAILLSVVLVGLAGMAFYFVVLNPLREVDSNNALLATMSVSFILIYSIQIMFGARSRFILTPIRGLHRFLGVNITNSTLTFFVFGMLILFGVYYFLLKAKIGKVIRATSQNKIGASLVGINIKKVYAITVSIAAALAGVAGAIMGPIWIVHSLMGQEVILKAFSIVVVSGMDNIKRAMLFGFILGITEALFAQYISNYYTDVYAFGILVLVLLFGKREKF